MNLPAIDVLRGLAALGVVWYHSRVDLWVGFRQIQSDPDAYSVLDRGLSWASLPVSQLGSLVMLFFVLSGFCIHLPQAGKGRMVDWSPYVIRRFLRIYPAYLVTLLFCFIATTALNRWFESGVPFNASDFWGLAMLQNWFAGGIQVALNPSLWSIPVEAELYVVYPLLLLIYIKCGMQSCLVFTLACTSVGWILHFQGLAVATGTFFKYAIIWNSGAWLAEQYVRGVLPTWTKWHTGLMLISGIVTPILGLAGVDHFYLDYGWGLSALLVLWWLITDGATWLPSDAGWLKPLTALGTISYSLYLIHFPLFKVFGAMWVETYGTKPTSFFAPTLATFAVIPFAWCFFKVFELPSHVWARRLAKRRATRLHVPENQNPLSGNNLIETVGMHPFDEKADPKSRPLGRG
ncbi:acyltransferase [Stieleria sp. ICT_E10.1]|uniref:acyltransferase family protein n=1 Tax=Stieleria sedimenti TaxID=2976331 RepID=UPI00217FA31A|nr:acyltransferase [Stieleria sedimenti]MCS7465773.1 acyltransferase [Stieleria sedimenti]